MPTPPRPTRFTSSRRQALGLALAGLSFPATARLPEYDIILTGGIVVDGSGAPARSADVAISGDRVAAIGPGLADRKARKVVDVSGLIVAPGFIEPHAHITDIAAFPRPENFLRQGITTIVNSLHSLDQPYPLAPFLRALKVAPNTAWTAGHSWERKRVMGLEDRAPDAAELARMSALVEEAMNDGALGLSTGLEYIPAAYSTSDELIALAKASSRPNAVYSTHMRDEGAKLMVSIDEALLVGQAAGVPVHINHIKTTGAANWGRSVDALDRIDAVRRGGQRVSLDVYPYTAYSTYSTVLFPPWSLAGGTPAFARRASDPANRTRIFEESRALYPMQTGGALDSIQFRDGVEGFAGKTLGDYLAANGRPQTLDAGINALIDLEASGGFTAIFHAMDDADIDRFLLHSQTCLSSDGDLIRFGEGFPHPRSYGAFPRLLGHYVRTRKLLTLEAAIHKITALPASAFALRDRGTLRPGAYADITVFDPKTIADRATFTDPHRYSVGVEHMWINGVPVLEAGRLTDHLPGRALRRELSPQGG